MAALGRIDTASPASSNDRKPIGSGHVDMDVMTAGAVSSVLKACRLKSLASSRTASGRGLSSDHANVSAATHAKGVSIAVCRIGCAP